LQKFPTRHELGSPMPAMPDRLSRAIPLQALKPFDGDGFADLIAPRRRAAAHLALPDRINHALAQVLRIRLRNSLLASAQPTG
jgi:hypothetical protein